MFKLPRNEFEKLEAFKELLDSYDIVVKGANEKRHDRNTYNDVAGNRLQPRLDKI